MRNTLKMFQSSIQMNALIWNCFNDFTQVYKQAQLNVFHYFIQPYK